MTRAATYRALAWLLAAATCASIAWAAVKPMSYLGSEGQDVWIALALIALVAALALVAAGRAIFLAGRGLLRCGRPRLPKRDGALLPFVLATWFVATFAILYSLDRSFVFCGGTTPYCYDRPPFQVYRPLCDLSRKIGWRGGEPFYVAEYESAR